VVDLIERRFGVRVSRWTAGRYLKGWGFTPQKPVRRAWEQNKAGVRRWLKEEYPQIRRQAKSEGALLYWADEMGLRSDHSAGRSFSPKGQTPVITGTGQRFRCNMISAITNQGNLSFMVFKESFTVAVFLRFLRRLIRQSKRKVYLIVDGHPVHRANLVRAWLEKHSDQITMFRLPSYSPELNPDEMLNQDVKSNALGRQRPAALQELMQRVRRYLRSRQRQPRIVQRYFWERHVRYAAA
jgi:transposase